MGCCINNLDSIEYAKSLTDIINIIYYDKNLFNIQLDIMKKDKNLPQEAKIQKINYLSIVIEKLQIYINYLNERNKKYPYITDLEITELKINYKSLLSNLDSMNYKNTNNYFDNFETVLYDL